MKINLQKAALTAGIVWGGTMFLTTLANVFFGYGKAFLDGMASIYPGYSLTTTGSIVGLIYGFLDAYIGIYVVVWIYKKLAK